MQHGQPRMAYQLALQMVLTRRRWQKAPVAGIEDPQCAHQFDLPRLGVCLLSKNWFLFTSQVLQVADAWRRRAGRFPKESSWQLLGRPHSPVPGVSPPQAAGTPVWALRDLLRSTVLSRQKL